LADTCVRLAKITRPRAKVTREKKRQADTSQTTMSQYVSGMNSRARPPANMVRTALGVGAICTGVRPVAGIPGTSTLT
jgi:hypothetical protein